MKKILTILFLCFTLPAMAATSDWLGETSKYLPGDYLTAEKAWCIQIEANIESPCTTVRDFQTQQQPEKNQYSVYGSVKDAKFKGNIPTKQGSTERTEFLNGIGYVNVYFQPDDSNEQRVAQTRTASGGAFGVWRRKNTPGTVIFRKEGYKEKRVNIDNWPSDGIIWLEKEDSTPQKSSTINETAKVTSENQTDAKTTTGQTRPAATATRTATTTTTKTTQSGITSSAKSTEFSARIHGRVETNGKTKTPISGAKIYYTTNGNTLPRSNDLQSIPGLVDTGITSDASGNYQFYTNSYTGIVIASYNGNIGIATVGKDEYDWNNISIDTTPVSNTTPQDQSPSKSTMKTTVVDDNTVVYETPGTKTTATYDGYRDPMQNRREKERKGGDGENAGDISMLDTGTVAEPDPESTPKTLNTITGKVVDENGEPISGAGIMPNNNVAKSNANTAITDSDGKFTLINFPSNTGAVVEAAGYRSNIIPANDLTSNMTIKMQIQEYEKGNAVLDTNITVGTAGQDYTNCTNQAQDILTRLNAKSVKWLIPDQNKKGMCIPTSCKSDEYTLKEAGSASAKCVKCTDEILFSTNARVENDICRAETCQDGFTTKNGNGKCVVDCEKYATKLNATKVAGKKTGPAKIINTGDYSSFCYATECDEVKYTLSGTGENAQCIEACDEKAKQELMNQGAFETMLSNGKCVAKSCKCEYVLQGDKCVERTSNDCTPETPGATKGEIICVDEKSVCKITACDTANGYELKDNKCECTALGFEKNKDGTCTPKMVLNREQYQDEIKKLSENAQKMRDNENSLINKTIGAAGIGAVGIGGSMVGAALSERAADDNAERAMRAYLNTFKCEYGDGKQINGGEVNVELPGGNDMFELYTEYATLANDLKVRKEALGLRPGIESEVSIDKSETGLYDDVGTGITGGAYASIARALQNPDGEDAKMWAAMRAATDSKLKTGAIVAGAGAAASLAANIAVNHNVKNEASEIVKKYEDMKHAFEQYKKEIQEEKPAEDLCKTKHNLPGTWPNCQCNGEYEHVYFNTEQGCIQCNAPLIVTETRDDCTCPPEKPVRDGNQCKEQTTACPLTGLKHATECKCIDNATAKNNTKCECNDGYEQIDGVCTKKPVPVAVPPKPNQGTIIATLDIKADNAFESGSDKVSTAGQNKLNAFMRNAKEQTQKANIDLKTENDYCLIIVGKTDHQGFKHPDKNKNNNQSLSERRANSVKDKLTDIFNAGNIKTYGIADKDCPKTPIANPECRVVNLQMLAGSCDDIMRSDNWITKNNLATIQQGIDALQTQIKK